MKNTDERMAQLYLERAAGHKHEFKQVGGNWRAKSDDIFYYATKYRTKRETVMIGDREVPAPMREKPKTGQKYWSIVHSSCHIAHWVDDCFDNGRFYGLGCYESEEDVQAVYEAMTVLLQGNASMRRR